MTPVSITSPLSSVGHDMLPNNPNSTLNSPPTKLPKLSTNVSRHDSRLDQIVTNFEKLHSPSKDMSNPIDNHKSAVTTGACTTPVSMSTSKLNVTVYSSPLKTPSTDTSSYKTASRNGSSHSPSMKSTDKPIIDLVRPPHTHSYYPYLYPPPPPQPYPYAIIPPIHSPYDVTKPSSKISPPPNETWPFSQFNQPTSSIVSKPSDVEQKMFYPHDIKPHLPTFSFRMALPHSPFPWYPNDNMSLSTPCFSHPNLPSTSSGNKIATTLKSEPKTPTLTEITTSVTNNQDYTPPTSVKECQDDQLDVVTIVPHKNESSESGTQSCIYESSPDYSSHFDLDDKLWGTRNGNILSEDTKVQDLASRPSSV